MREQDSAASGQRERPDVQGSGDRQSAGTPAGQLEETSCSPTGGRSVHSWQEAAITEPGLDGRGNVFFAAVEMTRMPMILTDPNQPGNPVVFANRAFLDLTGYREEEISGRNCRFLQGAQTDRAVVAELREAIAAQRPVSVELLNYKRDGTPFWNAVFIAPVHDRNGALLYFFASQLDVTRRRTSEQAFRQAQKMEAIGQLTAGLAHDFNNLLQVIAGNLELLDARLQDEKLRRHVERASTAAERGSKLTRQLLAFARKTRLDPQRADINRLIDDFGNMLESTAGSHVALRFNQRRRLPPVLVDRVHLEMALLNVVINARDAMPAGGDMTIATGIATLEPNGLPGGQYVTLSVTDSGAGMPPHVLERAAEPFFTTKGTGRGTGLGLAMVQGFVQQSRGKLEIESEPGRGTTVRMLFPVASEAAEAAPRAPLAAAGTAPCEIHAQQAETILLVEDSDDVQALAREHLQMLGYRILAANNADEALRLLDHPSTPPIDLLFSDILMPGSMNGLVLAERVRARLPGVAVLLTTGYNEDLVAEARAPAMDVLGKPYRRSELADRVRAALNRRSTGGDGAAHVPRPDHGPPHEA
ncbi:histidine kinase famiy protein [Roseomonas sp. E05]|uniref:histidine kinase famiy protein n=1 Tax=Roseomonas sp. E05 TaxID=3046310 RepID=UPI0024BA5197|nr:histidine kinase famiy protein [Roseomonas sp. E05]MDJ0391216.1 histidine kinase famiy protein [Roseomonas sp. E05]